jgi:ATP-dependent DNA ligase
VATFENGAALFSASRFSVVCERGLEGVVAKRDGRTGPTSADG